VRITLPDGVTFTPGEASATEPSKGRGSPKNPKPKRLGGAQVGPPSNPAYSSMGNSPAMPNGYYPVFSPPPRRPTPSPLTDSPGAPAFGDKWSPPTGGGPSAFRPITSSPAPAADAAGGPPREAQQRERTSPPPDSAQGGKTGTGTERRDTGFFLPRRSLRNSPKPAPLSPPSRDP
jgi:hypothetical protein